MTENERRIANAKAQAKTRQGVVHQLKTIDAKIEDLSGKLDAVLAAKLIRKSITQDNHHD
jgi:hypothetical protein